MKNFVDREHDQLAKQWDSIFEKEKEIKVKEKEVESLKCTWENYQAWHECDGAFYLAQAKKELENLKNF